LIVTTGLGAFDVDRVGLSSLRIPYEDQLVPADPIVRRIDKSQDSLRRDRGIKRVSAT
jgi:hypothetical protein